MTLLGWSIIMFLQVDNFVIMEMLMTAIVVWNRMNAG